MNKQQQRTRSQTKTRSAGVRRLLDALSQMPFVDSAELAGILGEPHATVHRTLTRLLASGVASRVSHGTAHLPSSHRYYLTASGIGEAVRVLGFDAPSDFVRAYPVSREWLALLIRRMDAVAAVYVVGSLRRITLPRQVGGRPDAGPMRVRTLMPPQGNGSTPRSPFTTACWSHPGFACERSSPAPPNHPGMRPVGPSPRPTVRAQDTVAL